MIVEATPPVIDLDLLLAPIPGRNPSGASLAYAPEYDEIRQARRAEDDTHQGDWQRMAKVAEWDRVVDLGSAALGRKTKDLMIAAWMTEALARLHQFAGLRDGLLLMRGIQDGFWETFHPEIDDGDLDSRAGPFLFLNHETLLPLVIRSIPLTAGMGEVPYSYLRWQESRATDNAGLKSQDIQKALVAEGKITSKQFDDEVALSSREFYETLFEDLRQAQAAFKSFNESTDQHFGDNAPSLINIRDALEDCQKLLEPILKDKRIKEPDATTPPPPRDETTPPPPRDEPPPPSPPPRDEPPPGPKPIESVGDAHQQILNAAAYLRENDGTSPVPYLVVRALRMAEVYGHPTPLDPARLVSPSSEARQGLRKLSAEKKWAELLERAEQAIGRPEGRAWLDAHRFAIAAMASSDDLKPAAAASRSVLRAFLADFPTLPDAELDDGTPAASAETRTWLEVEKLLPGQAEPEPEPASTSTPPTPEGRAEAPPPEPDAWDLALKFVKAGKVVEGLQLLRRARDNATTGREKFRRKLQMAELCLKVNNLRVALPLLEDLAKQVDEFHLENWEDEELCARVWGSLYRCLRGTGGENGAAERMQEAYTRLCRLDIDQALMYGDGK